MDNENLRSKLLRIFPDFTKSQDFVDELIETGQLLEFSVGTSIIDTGQYIKVIPFLVDGLIKIYRKDPEGNEILLYYINSGESCAISITASLKNEKSTVKAIIEEDSTVFVVPNHKFEYLLGKYNLLHTFTYDLFNNKYNQLIDSIDILAFTDMRTRLLKYLANESAAKMSNILEGLTHKKIAKDLATSREVVTRLLSSLQKEGEILLANRKIHLK